MRLSSSLAGAACVALLCASSLASAKCIFPLGIYGGAFSGAYVDKNNILLRNYALIMRMTFYADGSGFEDEIGKRNGGGVTGRVAYTNTFPAVGTAGHIFDFNTCTGEVTLSVGTVWIYVVTNDGNTIKGTMFTDNTNMLVATVELNRI